MRKTLKSFIFVIILGALFAAGLEYVNRAVLPVKARGWAERAASQALGRPVAIGSLRFHLWHGFLVEKISVQGDTPGVSAPLLEVEQVSGGILFLPIVRDRELIIPTLRVVRPRLRLEQDAQGRWNIEALIPKRAAKPARRGKFGVLIPRVVISGGEVRAVPAGAGAIPLRLTGLELEMSLHLPAKVECVASGELRTGAMAEDATPVRISLRGSYTPQGEQVQMSGRATVPLNAIPPHLPAEGRPAGLTVEGNAEVEMEAAGQLKGPLTLNVWLETEGLAGEAAHPLTTGWAEEPPPKLRVVGDLRGKWAVELRSLPDPDLLKHAHGVVDLQGLVAGPFPYVGRLEGISGRISLDTEGVRSDRITASLASGLPVEFSGWVMNDASRTAGFTLKSDFPLEKLPPLPEPWQEMRREGGLTGQVALLAEGKGPLLPAPALQPAGTFTFQNFGLTFPNGMAVRDVRGTVRAQADLLTVTDMSGKLMEKPFQLKGTCVNFSQPEVNAEGAWGDVTAQGQFTLFTDKVEIHSLEGKFGSSPFRVIGEVGRPDPVANLLLEAGLKMEELPALWPGKVPAGLKEKPPHGELSTRLLVEGDLRQPAACLVDLKATSPSLIVHGLDLREFALDLHQEEGKTELRSARAGLAGGLLSVSGVCAAREPRQPWTGHLAVQNVELAQLAQQLKWNTQEMSGQLNIDWDGAGRGTDLAALSGPGAISVKGARILELPLLGKFAELLSIPTLKTIAFTEAQGPFQLSEGRVHSDGFTLTSPQATLTMKGWGGFLEGGDSRIDWRVLPTLSPELIPKETRSKIGKAIAKGTSYLIGEIQVTGTWKKPKTEFVSKPIMQILNEQLFNLQDLLKDVF